MTTTEPTPPLAWYDRPEWNQLPPPPPQPRRRVNPWVGLLALVVALAALVLGIAALANRGTEPVPSSTSALVPATASTTAVSADVITGLAQLTADQYGATLCLAVRAQGHDEARADFVTGFITTATSLPMAQRKQVGRQVFDEAVAIAGCES